MGLRLRMSRLCEYIEQRVCLTAGYGDSSSGGSKSQKDLNFDEFDQAHRGRGRT